MKFFIGFISGGFLFKAAMNLLMLVAGTLPVYTATRLGADLIAFMILSIWGLVLLLKEKPNDSD